MAAKRLYDEAGAGVAARLQFEATVTDIRLVWREASHEGGQALWQIALDRTAFCPTDGGQPCDTGVLVAVARSGAMLEVAVERVEEDEAGELWHFVRKPLVEGTMVTGTLDAARGLRKTTADPLRG